MICIHIVIIVIRLWQNANELTAITESWLALCDEGISHLRRAGGVRGRDPGERGRRSTHSVLIQVNDKAFMIRHKLAVSHQGWTPVASA